GSCADADVSPGEIIVDPAVLIPQQRFYRSGQLMASFSITPDSLLYGPYDEYDTSGRLLRWMHYKNGRQHGLYESYYISGQLASRHVFVDGQAHGPYSWYFENGQLMQQGRQVSGLAEGMVESYNVDGGLQSRRNYVRDRPVGPALEYYPEGQLRTFSGYDRLGQRRFYLGYDENGAVEETFGRPFLDLEASLNRYNGTFSLAFDLALPPEVEPELRLIRRRD